MAGVPQKVQKEAKEAEKILQELQQMANNEKTAANKDETNPEEQALNNKPEATPEKLPDSTIGDEGSKNNIPIEEAQKEEDNKAEKPQQENIEDYKAEVNKLKEELARTNAELAKVQHQYNVLKGKEYAEVPRLQAENKELKEKISKLEAALQSKNYDSDKTAEEALDDFALEYGEEASKALDKRIQSAIAPILEQNKELKNLLASITGKQYDEQSQYKIEKQMALGEESAKQIDRYSEALRYFVPDLEIIRDDPKFAQFLNMIEPKTQRSYWDLLSLAHDNRDAMMVAQIYRTFKVLNQSPDATTTVEKANKAKEHLVSPNSNARASSKIDDSKPTFSRQEIEAHYLKARKNPALQADPQWQQKAKQYDLALVEGRII